MTMLLGMMLPTEREEPFDDDDYLFEPLIAGLRLLLFVRHGKARLYTGGGIDVTAQYPELLDVPVASDAETAETIIDGVVTCVDPQTHGLDYESLMERSRLRMPVAIMQARVRRPVVYCAFDILRYQGEDVRDRPLIERKRMLDGALGQSAHYYPVFHEAGAGRSLYRAVESKLGGIVAKRMDSPYVGRRDAAWQRILHYRYADVEIAGYRKHSFGWLLQYRDRRIGVLERSVPSAHRKAFYGVSRSIRTGEDSHYVYVQPCLKARIRYRPEQWRAGGVLSPEFVDFVV